MLFICLILKITFKNRPASYVIGDTDNLKSNYLIFNLKNLDQAKRTYLCNIQLEQFRQEIDTKLTVGMRSMPNAITVKTHLT